MKIYLKKFGTILMSRPAGREASLAFSPLLNEIKKDEPVMIDFDGVVAFSPSWGAEFLGPIAKKFKDRVVFLNTENPSVKTTLELLKEIGGV
ncbi:MAG: DUF4325 domain-containing protein [Patescibacteria group bacterium]